MVINPAKINLHLNVIRSPLADGVHYVVAGKLNLPQMTMLHGEVVRRINFALVDHGSLCAVLDVDLPIEEIPIGGRSLLTAFGANPIVLWNGKPTLGGQLFIFQGKTKRMMQFGGGLHPHFVNFELDYLAITRDIVEKVESNV